MRMPKATVVKIVVSDPKTAKSVQIEVKEPTWLYGKKIGDIIDGSKFGLEGYKLEITGGSDIAGFPMRKEVEGAVRKKIWWWVDKRTRVKKTVYGNTISDEIVQVNTKILEYGQKPFEEIYNEFKQKKSESK